MASIAEQQPVVKKEVVAPNKTHDGAQDTYDALVAAQWTSFVTVEEIQREPLLYSVLSQGVCLQVESNRVTVQFVKELSFFESVVRDEHAVWQPHFQRIFSSDAQLIMEFTGEAKIGVVQKKSGDVIHDPLGSTDTREASHKSEPSGRGGNQKEGSQKKFEQRKEI